MSSTTNRNQGLAWVAVLLILTVTAWFGVKALSDAKPEETAGGGGGGRPPSTVIFKVVEEKQAVERLRVTGTLRAVRRAEVAAREAAAVDALNVDEGDLVKAGDVLGVLDGRRMAAQLAEAEAALISARAELAQRVAESERAVQDEKMMSGLWDEKAVAEREYLDSVRGAKVATARADAARESIDAAAKRLDLFKVRRTDLDVKAPFDGRVVARHAELGEWVQAGDPLVTLVSTGEIEAWLQLPERHIGKLKTTTPDAVTLTIPGQKETIRADKLALVPDVEGRSRRFTIIAHIPDPNNTLTPGGSVEAEVPLGKPEPRMAVPSDAILQSYAGSFVWVVRTPPDAPPAAERVPVELLFERDGEAFVAPGALNAGDKVIVEGNERLFPGTPIAPMPWAETRGGERGGGKPQPGGS
jgi:RND family efflux transporter MFP subunit